MILKEISKNKKKVEKTKNSIKLNQQATKKFFGFSTAIYKAHISLKEKF